MIGATQRSSGVQRPHAHFFLASATARMIIAPRTTCCWLASRPARISPLLISPISGAPNRVPLTEPVRQERCALGSRSRSSAGHGRHAVRVDVGRSGGEDVLRQERRHQEARDVHELANLKIDSHAADGVRLMTVRLAHRGGRSC
jgi:hypothetical protein